ncbi:MAG: hypothetical protein KAT43_03230 [Nanoarchaeota archaeon]|nr:hypothetical protein [Nanoarchaeota archaeon]
MERVRKTNSQTNFLAAKSRQMEKDIDNSTDNFDAEREEVLNRLNELKRKIDSTNKNIEDAKDRMKAVIKEMQQLASTGDLQLLKSKLGKWHLNEFTTISDFMKQMEEDL